MSTPPVDGYLEKLSMFGIKPGLEATSELFRRIGNPERSLRFLHIAGTNGKGSTGAMLECMLRSAGFTTGFYTSPHLIDIRERFRVNGLAVSETDYAVYSAEVAEAARAEGEKNFTFTYFEFTTALAALIFARAGVDIVIWETGMGGRLDSTNVVTPVASVITNIALDHQAYLGDSIDRIAAEKGGIIKPGVPVFSGRQLTEAGLVLAEKAAEVKAEGFYDVLPEISEFEHGFPQKFVLAGRHITLPLVGAMQRRNFQLAALVILTLADRLGIDVDKAFAGVARCRWPGRCQVVNDRLIVDGGHNPDGLTALTEALAEAFPGERFTVVFAGFKDKDVSASLRHLAPLAKRFCFAPLAESDRASYSGEELCELASGGIACAGAADAVERALLEPERVLVAGSLYLAGEVLGKYLPHSEILNLA